MKLKEHSEGIKELKEEGCCIKTAADLLDIYMENGINILIIKKEQLNPEFYNLASGLAGEMLQKVSNYWKKLAIVGNFSDIPGKPFADFIKESNKNRQVMFVPTTEEALLVFSEL